MGRLIYSFNVSLDGYIETVDKSLDWSLIIRRGPRLFQRPDAGARRVALRPAPVGPHERPLADRRGRPRQQRGDARLRAVRGTPRRRSCSRGRSTMWTTVPDLANGDVGEELAKVRREFDGDLEVGGANLAAQFIERGLVDEYRLMIHPVAIGGGTPFWPAGQRRSRPRDGLPDLLERLPPPDVRARLSRLPSTDGRRDRRRRRGGRRDDGRWHRAGRARGRPRGRAVRRRRDRSRAWRPADP